MKRRIIACLTVGALFVYAGNALAGFEGSINTFYGTGAGNSTTGDNDYDAFIGAEAGYSNTSGAANVFLGYRSGYANTTGDYNTFIGFRSGYFNTTGRSNTFIGHSSGYDNTGDYNTFIGYSSGNSNTTGSSNTFIGYRSGNSNTSGATSVFLGYGSGYSNTTGYSNTFLGYRSGYSNTTGSSNTFLGTYSGYSNTTGEYNTFLGQNAGYSNTDGYYNTFIGIASGRSNSTGYSNTFLGYLSGYSNTTSYSNTFLGTYSGYSNTTGYRNTFLGRSAGYNNVTGNNNVFIGYQAGYDETGSNKLYIDSSSTSTPLIWGDFSTNILAINGHLGIGTSSPSEMLEISGGSAHLKLKNPTLNSADAGKLIFSESSVDAITLRYDGSVDIFFVDTWSVNNALVIKRSDGYIGLGTSTPSSRLTVAGVIESTIGGIKFPDTSILASANTINADTLDGFHSSAFALSHHYHSGADVTSGIVGAAYVDTVIARDSEIMPAVLANDGSASTLDADLLDGQDSSAFMSASTDNWVDTSGDTMTGDLIVSGSVEIDVDLFVNGNTYVDSDEKVKKDIQPIESSLNRILGIEGVAYKWKKRDSDTSERMHYGVIAQQIEKVLPEVVQKGDDGIRKVAYMELIPVLIEAVKEQQAIIEGQNKTITKLNEQNRRISERMAEIEKELKLKRSMAMADIK